MAISSAIVIKYFAVRRISLQKYDKQYNNIEINN